MKKNFEISFCIPVYNTKDYLDKCIQSILMQDLEGLSYEILAVDDCSTDGSHEYLNKISQTIPEMRVLKNNTNQGISYTRNFLMAEARGRYIWFIDADDMIYPGAFRYLWSVANKEGADSVIGNYIKVSEEAGIPHAKELKETERYLVDVADFAWLPDEKGDCQMKSSWRGLFRRRFLIEKNIRFNNQVLFKEDALFYYEFCIARPKIWKCEQVCYCYRQRHDSVMNSASESKKKLVYTSTVALIEAYEKLTMGTHAFTDELKMRIIQEKADIIRQLSRIRDTHWVKTEVKKLEENSGSLNFFDKIKFWVFHYLYKNIKRS